MTRRVLTSHKLPTLRSGNPELDRWVEQYLQSFVSEVFEQMRFLTPETGTWTPAISGLTTAGTYELVTASGHYYKAGDLVFATFLVQLEAVITGGGAGLLQITGLPFEKAGFAQVYYPTGDVFLQGPDTSTCVNLSLGFQSSGSPGSTLFILQTVDDAPSVTLPITALAAQDSISGSIVFIAGDRSG